MIFHIDIFSADQVLQFLYSNAVTIEICPFTLDELALALTDKVNYHKFWFKLHSKLYIHAILWCYLYVLS